MSALSGNEIWAAADPALVASQSSHVSLSRPSGFDPGEGTCQICQRQYRVWSAASPLWNAVCRGGSINGNEAYAFLCANCFMEIAEDSGIASCFQLRAAKTANLETVTPSGRVWDDRDFLWK